MKKRLFSLALAIVMVFSLLPINAFAIGNTTILSQPTGVTVQAGETAEFSITAVNTKAEAPLEYIWYDNSKVDDDKLLYTKTIDEFFALFDGAKLGTGSKLTVTNVHETLNIRCVVYWQGTFLGRSVAKDVEKSNVVTLTVKAACASHVLGQNLFEVPATEPTCAHEGNIRYYKCNTCGYCYSDANGINVTTVDACKLAKLTTHKMPLTYHEPTAGTCGTRSMAEYWSCDECGDVFKDEAGTLPTTLTSLKLEGKTDANNHPADKVTHKEYTDATCSQKGNFEYWFCDECNTYFKDADLKTKYASRSDTEIAKDASKHPKLTEHAYTAATCDKDGNLPYYECTACGKYYANADGTGEYSKKSDVTIKATGHNYAWIEFTVEGTSYHAQECIVCHTRKNTGTHSGGTANCKSPAICSTCGFAYGETDPNNHLVKETRNAVDATINSEGYSGDVYCADCGVLLEVGHKTDKLCKHTDPSTNVVIHHGAVEATCVDAADRHQGNIEYWECSECGKCWTDSALTMEVAKADTVIAYQQHYIKNVITETANSALMQWGSNVNDHWKECKFCGYVYADTKSAHNITEKTLTCHSGNICRTCGYDDGQRDPYNHDGGTEVRNATEPTDFKAGYTGDTYCLGCNAKLSSGHTYFKPCSGGCKHLKKIEGTPATCTEDGTKTYYECIICHNYYMDEKATVPATDDKLIDKCTGHDLHPTLNLLGDISYKQLLDLIGSVNYSKVIEGIRKGTISIDDVLKNLHVRDIDHCSDDQYHWLGCQRCGKTFADLKPEFEQKGIYIKDVWYTLGKKEAHSGGTATCKEKAVCTECGDSYGSLAPHRYGEDNKCTVCGATLPACEAPTLSVSIKGKIVLSWNAVEGAASYQVYRTTGSNTEFDKIATVNGTTFTDTTAAIGTKYYYKVRAIGTNGSYGAFSYEKAAKFSCSAPALKITTSSGHPKIYWKKVNGAKEYKIYRCTDGVSYKYYDKTKNTSYTNLSTTIGTTYYYKVKAVSADGIESGYSVAKSIQCRPAAPSITITRSGGKPQLKWSAVSGATKYWIYRSTDGTNYKYYDSTTKTSYKNSSTNVGTTYYYKVKAVKVVNGKNVASAYSNSKSLLVSTAAPSVSITASGGHPKLSWKAVSGATKYWVYRSTDGVNFKYYDSTTRTTYTNTGAKSGMKYYYKVKSVKVVNGKNIASAYSNTVSIKAR